MGYEIKELQNSDAEQAAIARFLAEFVRDGELENPRPKDDETAMWEKRMRWWWDENPHCTPETPRGYYLEHSQDGIVGFNGYIPCRFEVDGKEVPSLIATTFFVRPEHRGSTIGLLSRQRMLGRSYQIIDGSPSPEVRYILDKMGYQQAEGRVQAAFPTLRVGGGLARAVLRGLGWSFSLPPRRQGEGYCIVTDARSWSEPAFPKDGRVRRSADAATLDWLIRSGSEARHFFGLLDPSGRPVARALGVYRLYRGILVCRLLDYRDMHDVSGGNVHWGPHLDMLLRKLLDEVDAVGLDPTTDVIVVSRFFSNGHPAASGRQTEAILRYHLPKPWQDREKVIVPAEGDLIFL